MIVVVSDIHLGYEKCTKDHFDKFIDSKLTKLTKDDSLVILGDLLDFWRKNCVDVTVVYKSGSNVGNLVLDNKDGIIIKKLYDLQKQTQVYYVIGNHDYSVLHFSKRSQHFPFNVLRNLHLSEGGNRFYFIHGYEFEVMANFVFTSIEEYESICQHLCDLRDTTISKIESSIWSALHPQFVGKSFEDHHTIVKSIVRPPEYRMKELHLAEQSKDRMKLVRPRNKIEELAMSPVARSMFVGGEPDEAMIFGHTHSPFITEDRRVANSGSWVADNDFHDTYIEIDNNGDMKLKQYA